MDITLGCSLDDLKAHEAFHRYAFINIENLLFPGYLDQDYRDDLDYLQRKCRQRLVLDGPYIDLNLGSPEPRARQLAQEKTLEAISYAEQCSAELIIFQSTFLPFIGLDSYERGWIDESVRSWKTILAPEPRVRIALCNTFEYNPDNLIEIVESLDHPLEIAFDVGHCLIWGKLNVQDWYQKIRDRCQVVYLHSNDGHADQHRSIRMGVFAEKDVLKTLNLDLRMDSVVILKYFDKTQILADIDYLESILN